MATSPQPPSATKQGKENTAILIVDDEADILTVFKKSLELHGYSTYGFVNPSAALEHFRPNPTRYQVIISDVRMPGMSGFELAREVRRINQDVRIILMTSFEISMSEFKKVMPSTHIDGLVQKPVSIGDLKILIEAS